MPEPPELLPELLTHLVDAGLVRDESAPTGATPRLFLDPREGVPEPTDDDGGGAVLAAFLTGGIRAKPREKGLRQDLVEIRIRAKKVMRTWDLYRVLRGELIDRQAWMMGAREVLDCQEWGALQRLGSDEKSYAHSFKLFFLTRA